MPHLLSDGRASGVLLPVFSLPGGAIGDFGASARAFVDALAAAGQSWWQVLPLGPTAERFGNSPYSSLSTSALELAYLSLDDLAAEGRETAPDGSATAGRGAERVAPGAPVVDYARARDAARCALALAHERLSPEASAERTRWRGAQQGWLDDWALFVALGEAYPERGWTEWPDRLRDREPQALARARGEHAQRIELEVTAQFLLDQQWAALRGYAGERGVRLFGDLPMYVVGESVDVWVEREAFQLDAAGRPTAESGVPPDKYAEDGQAWATPVYDWERQARDGFAWWARRLRRELERFDLLRLDHFRGFSAYWSIPAGCSSALGAWVRGPGADWIRALASDPGFERLVAEDLGLIDEPVRELLELSGMPGMRVLQFAYDGDDPGDAGDDGCLVEMDAGSEHLPENVGSGCVVYTGTHDNDTLLGWMASLSPARRGALFQRVGAGEAQAAAKALIQAALDSRAALAIVPLQDVLGLDGRARINTPGTAQGNWLWRMLPEQLEDTSWVRSLLARTEAAGRDPAAVGASRAAPGTRLED